MPKFRDIKQYTSIGNYNCDFSWEELINYCDNILPQCFPNFTMCPNFQRGNVWTEEQQIAYIEFLLKGGKTARTIYLNIPNFRTRKTLEYQECGCVDGLQRYTAIKRFINNEIKVFGYYKNEYDDEPDILNQQLIHLNINNLKTRKEVLQWYIDFNSGGTIHSSKEIERVKQLLEECK